MVWEIERKKRFTCDRNSLDERNRKKRKKRKKEKINKGGRMVCIGAFFGLISRRLLARRFPS